VPHYSLGIDIGGTFTDIVIYDHDSGRQINRKVLTTHDDPARAVAAGVDGVIVPDLPPEEGADLYGAFAKRGLDGVLLASPTTTPARMRMLVHNTRGFLYYVSLTGVTTARSELAAGIESSVAGIRRLGDIPVCVGFGVSRPEHAREIAVVSVHDVGAVAPALALVVLAESERELGKRLHFLERTHLGALARNLFDEPIDVAQLLDRAPALVACAPARAGIEPHGDGLGEVFSGVALGVPAIEVTNVALAVPLRAIVSRVGRGPRSEDVAPAGASMECECGVERVRRLVSYELHALVRCAALDLSHLPSLEINEARRGEIERNREARHSVRRKPLGR